MKQYQQHLDVLKGVVIFLVVVGHAFHFGFAYYRSPVLMALRSIDMPIFLFLSGLLAASPITFSREGVRGYWLKKSRQLLLPLLSLPTLYAVLYRIPASEMIWGMMHGGYWFTLVLFEMFVLMFIFRGANHLLNRDQQPLLEVILALLSLVFVLAIDPVWRELSPASYQALSWGKTNYLYYYFLIGYFAGRYPELRDLLTSTPIQATTGVAFVLLIYAEYISGVVLEGLPASLCGMTFAYATACRLGRTPSRLNRGIAALGKESRTLYLTHYLFLFSAPMGKTFLNDLPRDGRIVMWELLLSFAYASIVICTTLVAVRIIKSNALLACLCYGKRLPSAETPSRASSSD